ncbi:DNA gyrase subunit A [Candidatus Aminicenantes bacterium AC-708-M15]|jgi:DNA gyrase subunit A|nr:DNA gyrase subunit A [SCandidatus Aminicenantes bacterium Aminicenantia_JdfR_composite]MCP2597945.1 DNA gyrase subunit A [Candidatus Aminicenantes bacterium AC-335-L06]MCP2598983.1 DNA gyrase subunit A [Candidatus Aminicenantes bacterium AC-335-B20]MCP2604308.1 DNA gyrase subunit A [Candidatus Aminicenantes bacterium AC-708-M15]MCP2606073.1 DNA gyrase subunit A [Candidatus Aminicenantes bacterium AC-708-I09]MCP2618544.1 DNA gyrase subunit A [Candidatus Aminicenantes bacterium AC-335-A11]
MEKGLIPVSLEEEMKRSYLDYAMSVIIGRAIPDIRDGLKPVHRRTLYAMHEANNTWDKPYKKSARIVGDVIGKYHPHGEAAVYDALVRMAQDFTMRYPLVDGQGNFGSIDGDPPAAMRYTEVRMAKIAGELLADIEKNTVEFVPNYDESLLMPEVLPAKFPNLLVNGGSGIAVGMATNIPPHNLGEVIDATIHLINNPDADIEELMEFLPGPDFPTGAYICGREGIREAYRTGKGVIYLRGKAIIEKGEKGQRDKIIITEIPYLVNKAKLLEKIADLVKNKKMEGVLDIRDESDREGLRIVIELRKGEPPEIILNNLYKHTPLQTSFGIIFLAIVNNQPRLLNLKELLKNFISFREEVVRRRTKYELDKAERRAHILEGLNVALDNLDEVINLIRKSKTVEEARQGLILKFKLTKIQAQAILDLQLQKLTGLEREKLQAEYLELIKTIARLKEILANEKLILNIIVEELQRIKKDYQDERRTEIIDEPITDLKIEDLIAEEQMVITYTSSGYVKRTSLSSYQRQKRGGKGKIGIRMKEEDVVEQAFVASTHSYLLIFTNKGQIYWLKALSIPEADISGKGKAIVNLINISSDEKIASVVPVKDFNQEAYLLMLTNDGLIKKTELRAFSNPRAAGIRAISLSEGRELKTVKLTDGKKEIIIGTKFGKAIRFSETQVRPMGRTAEGVRAISLSKGDEIVGMIVISENERYVFTITEKGYGKKTPISEYRAQNRGGMGIITHKINDKVGNVVGIMGIDEEEMIVITAQGKVMRIKTKALRPMGRMTQGVRIIDLGPEDRVASVVKVIKEEEE